MTVSIKTIIMLCFFITAGIMPVRAASPETYPDFASCPALRDPAKYVGDFAGNELFFNGKEGYVFRSTQDLRMNFHVDKENMALWQKLTAVLSARGIDLVVAFAPTHAIAEEKFLPESSEPLMAGYDPAAARKNYADLIVEMNQAGVHFVGLPSPAEQYFFNKADQHWSQAGAREMAQAVAQSVHSLPAWQNVQKTAFATETVKNAAFSGTYNKVLKPMCGFTMPDEADIETQTKAVPAVGTDAETAMLGNQPPPQIVLLGTSNSHKDDNDTNFEGFLKTAIGADITNAALTGGGLDDSVVTYTSSDMFRTTPPKIFIWEIPGYYDLSGNLAEKTLRQTIAAVQGPCANVLAATSGPVTLDRKRNVILGDLADKNIGIGRSYIMLKFAEPMKKDFTVAFDSVGDKHESQKFETPISNISNVFYYMPEGDSTLQSVTLTVADAAVGSTVTDAQICPMP